MPMTKKHHFLDGGGETGALMRNMDWSKNPLGLPDTWTSALKFTVRAMLDSPLPMSIGWGNDFIRLYNDHYIRLLGANNHPSALGRPIPEVCLHRHA